MDLCFFSIGRLSQKIIRFAGDKIEGAIGEGADAARLVGPHKITSQKR